MPVSAACSSVREMLAPGQLSTLAPARRALSEKSRCYRARLPNARAPVVRCQERGQAEGQASEAMRKKAAVLLTGLAATCQVLSPFSAFAADAGLFEKSKQLEAELQEILIERGATLKALEASPKPDFSPERSSEALRVVAGSGDESLAELQVRSLQAELERQDLQLQLEKQNAQVERLTKELEQTKRAIEAQQREMASQSKQLATANQQAEAARQQAAAEQQKAAAAQQQAAAAAEAARKQAAEAAAAKQAAAAAAAAKQKAEAEAAKQAAAAAAAKRQVATAKQEAAAGAKPAPKPGSAAEKMAAASGEKRGFSGQDVAGLLTAGGIAGYLFFSRKEGQLQMERELKEALGKEKSLAEAALAAERQLSEAVRREAAATEAALRELEPVATENRLMRRHLKRELEEVNAKLEKERQFTQRLRAEAARINSELQQALQQNSALAGQMRDVQSGQGAEGADAADDADNRIWRKHLQRTLDEVNAKLEAERQATKRLRAESARLNAQLQEALSSPPTAAAEGWGEEVEYAESRLEQQRLQRELEEVKAALESERRFSARLKEEADRTAAQLGSGSSGRASLGQLDSLGSDRIRELERTMDGLARQLEAAVQEAERHKAAFEKAMSMRDTMTAQNAAQVEELRAALARAQAEATYSAATEELDAERARIAELEAALRASQEDLAQRTRQLEEMASGGMAGADALRGEVAALQEQAQSAAATEDRLMRRHLQRSLNELTAKLEAEREATKRARAEAARARAQLNEALASAQEVAQSSGALQDALSRAEEAEAKYERAQEELRRERERISSLETELRSTQEDLADLSTQVKELVGMLSTNGTANGSGAQRQLSQTAGYSW